MPGNDEGRVILWGLPHSLCTGKTRAFLRKQGIAYVERSPADPVFREQVLPAIGRSIIPVIRLPDGTVVQDTVTILDHFEAQGVPLTAVPPGSRQRTIAHIAELYANMVLVRHAMHYRWSVAEQQRDFLTHAFGSRGGEADRVMARMASYLPGLGVTPETIPAIEQSYAELLAHLDAHFRVHPYLLGAQPSLGDYGLLGPLYAHLGRDPVPAGLMKRHAPALFRWTERMNAPDLDLVDFPGVAPGYLPDDAVPETLAPLLRQIALELVPQAEAVAGWLDHFVAEQQPRPGDPVSAKAHQRTIGVAPAQFRGAPFSAAVQPYHLWLWQRVAAEAEAPGVRDCLAAYGLAPLLDITRPIRVERQGHIEVWGKRI